MPAQLVISHSLRSVSFDFPASVDASIRPIAETFCKNAYRPMALRALMLETVMTGMDFGRAESKVLFERFGRLYMHESESTQGDEVFSQIKDEYLNPTPHKPPPNEGAWKPMLQVELISNLHFMRAVDQIGVDAFVSLQLVTMWTAFESMAGDLWVAAVNARPASLGKNAFTFRPKRSDDAADPTTAEIETREKESKGVPFHLLAGYGFDLSNSMGDYFKSTKKFDFNRLRGIREMYGATFGPTHKNELRDIWGTAEPESLRALELLRNVIVHCGGILDKQFKKQSQDIPSLASLAENEHVPLSEPMLQAFSVTVAERGMKLIRFVDDWLRSNPT
jgi:hypothetical protein